MIYDNGLDPRIRKGVFVRAGGYAIGQVWGDPYMSIGQLCVALMFPDNPFSVSVVWPLAKCKYLAQNEHDLAIVALGEEYFW